MTRVVLLQQFGALTLEITHDILLPTKMQKGDQQQEYRAADVFLTRLPDSSAATKKAPYILHQLITGKDAQAAGEPAASSALMRSIFCVYSEDEQAGGLMLLNLMERVRIALLRQVIVGGQFELDLKAGLESLVYPEDSAPFYAGEMISNWRLPPIKREVRNLWQ